MCIEPDDTRSTFGLGQTTNCTDRMRTITFQHYHEGLIRTPQGCCNFSSGASGNVAKVGHSIARPLASGQLNPYGVEDVVSCITQGIDQARVEVCLGATCYSPARNVVLVGNANNCYIHASTPFLLAILPYGRVATTEKMGGVLRRR